MYYSRKVPSYPIYFLSLTLTFQPIFPVLFRARSSPLQRLHRHIPPYYSPLHRCITRSRSGLEYNLIIHNNNKILIFINNQ